MPTVTIDCPVGGINAFDSPENMAPTDAIALDNWIPRSGYLESRPPIEEYVDLTFPVTTLMVHHAEDGTETFIAYTNGDDKWWDISTSTPSEITALYGATSWQGTHINDVLVLVNGEGTTELSFNGTAFTALDYTGSSPAVTAGNFVNVENFKGRAFYVDGENNKFWYAAAGSYQGALSEFDLSSISQHGGAPIIVKTWTMDTGIGPDDTLVIIYDTGEVLLYQGDDPGDPDNWEIIGRYRIPPPTGLRSASSYGPDLIILTRNGYVNIVDVLKTDQRSDYPAFSRRIWPMIEDYLNLAPNAASARFTEMIPWQEGLLIFNVGRGGANSGLIQFVLNVNTGGWCRFTGIEAYQFQEYNRNLYAGSGGPVYKLSTYATATEEITVSAIPAFTDLGDPNNKKHVTAVQFNTNHPDPSLIEVTGYSDFNLEGSLPTPTAYAGGGAPSEATVGTFPNVRKAMFHTTTKGWQNLHAFGFNVSMAVQMATDDRTLYWRQQTYRVRRAGGQ